SSDQGPNAWAWSITPTANAKFETKKTVQSPSVYFTRAGFYDVKLVATNSFGADSLTKANYIEVFNYCLPAVGVLNTDMEISRVKFGDIDNRTTQGAPAYSSFFEDFVPYRVIKNTSFEILIERFSPIQDEMNRKVWIDWNGDADFDDIGEE